MKNILDYLIAKHHISNERIVKIIASFILYDSTTVLLERVQKDVRERRGAPSKGVIEMAEKYMEMFTRWMVQYDIPASLSDLIRLFLIRAINDNISVYYMIYNPLRTNSAMMILRYANVSYSLGFQLPISIIDNDEEKRQSITNDFLTVKKGLKDLVENFGGFEAIEIAYLRKWDEHLNDLLLKNGEGIEICSNMKN